MIFTGHTADFYRRFIRFRGYAWLLRLDWGLSFRENSPRFQDIYIYTYTLLQKQVEKSIGKWDGRRVKKD